MGKTFGGYCDGCKCGFSLTNSLEFWNDGDFLFCSECSEVADSMGAGLVEMRMKLYDGLYE